MLNLLLTEDPTRELTVLCLGAHSDDIEIGCGGTILSLAERYPKLNVNWVVFSGDDDRQKEARQSADKFLKSVGGKREIIVKDFRDGYFPFTGDRVKDCFEELKPLCAPDIIFTHSRQDAHQDHRLICELTWNTWRNHLILEYEVPKWDGDMGRPNFYVPLTKETAITKVDLIMNCFGTQGHRHWFTSDLFYSLMRIRGMEARAPENYAEAFYGRKAILL